MSDQSFQKKAELWGKAYEILVKRGVLARLSETGLLESNVADLAPWKETKLTSISTDLLRALDILDEREYDLAKRAFDHLAHCAYGLGYTATREYLKPLEKDLARKKLTIAGLWCPLTLPGEDTSTADKRRENLAQFCRTFSIPATHSHELSAKGFPANADFLLLLAGEAKEEYALVQEYSYDMPPELGDFHGQEAHIEELQRHRRLIDSRGVFARVAAEVDGESFSLSQDIRNHLTALTGENKPFYKLCQASSYADTFAQLRHTLTGSRKPLNARALAITPNGLESLAGRFASEESDPRIALMQQMGDAYRRAEKLPDNDEEGLARKVEAVFNSIHRKLPKGLRDGMKPLKTLPEPGKDYLFEFEERLPQFANPTDRFSVNEALALIVEDDDLNDFFGGSARESIGRVVQDFEKDGSLSLRDIHASAIVAGMKRSATGTINVIALEGNPGIGKTTAIRKYLGSKQEGYLFLYVSPRVVINRDVTESLARKDGKPTGILTLTSNAQINAAAQRFYDSKVKAGLAEKRRIDGAVIADGVPNLATPTNGSLLVLTPEEETEIDTSHAGSTVSKQTISEYEDVITDTPRTGVLAALSQMTRELRGLNPNITRITLTAALQGFRERGGGKTTMDALSKLFENKADTPAGVKERKKFAEKSPNIVVMVDELAGDGAGAPFVHSVARWLSEEFLDPFEDEVSPFTVTLVVSDASLGNEVVLGRYLEAGDRTPDKVLISRSSGDKPFQLAVTKIRVGGARRRTLHVMTNSFPAKELNIRYQAKLTAVRIQETETGELETPRQAIRRVREDVPLDTAEKEIRGAIGKGAFQIIYFAQDKIHLSELRGRLIRLKELGLNSDTVQILDSSVPGWKRKQLVEPKQRDSTKVFLMTSSGARGVSFPRTDWIIATVPRFNIESALMEIAQLIYRGRGGYRDEDGKEISGDNVPRQLVMMIDDFVVADGPIDKRQWLRQSIDLMTLLIMLRSTIWTRITGAAGLRQSLALVPVGAVGTEELINIMSQNVSKFVDEAEVYFRRATNKDKIALIKSAQANVVELFSRTKLLATAKKDIDGRTFVKACDIENFLMTVTSSVVPLLVEAESEPSIPNHAYFTGPVIVEDWSGFSNQEVFAFEGHKTQEERLSARLLGQLRAIDEDRDYPSALRNPAANLYKLLIRDKEDAGKEFSTIKELKSPNTWIAIPAGYTRFINNDETVDGHSFYLQDAELWMDGLAGELSATSATMPPIAKYQSFPWVASVGKANPLKLDQVFDDRYFMASNELNLLNTLLLEATESE